jgi:hypothetical protein
MVTGELPFRSLNPLDAWMKKINNDLPGPRKVNPGISERVDWAIRRSMSADPNLRAASCREFIEDLTGKSSRKVSSEEQVEGASDWWYLVYKDDDGVVHTVKGTKQGVRRSLKENLLGDAANIRVSPSRQGPFVPMRQHPEFRDLIIDPERTMSTLSELEKTVPRSQLPPPGGASAASAGTKSGPNPLTRSGPIKKPGEPAKTSAAPGPVLLDIPEDDPVDDFSTDWTRYLLFMVAGTALGVVVYFLLLRVGIRLF